MFGTDFHFLSIRIPNPASSDRLKPSASRFTPQIKAPSVARPLSDIQPD